MREREFLDLPHRSDPYTGRQQRCCIFFEIRGRPFMRVPAMSRQSHQGRFSSSGAFKAMAWLLTLLLVGLLMLRVHSKSLEAGDTPGETHSNGRQRQSPKSDYLFFVNPSGNDSGPGSAPYPFRTIQRAQQAIRDMKKAHGGHVPPPGIEVFIAAGVYDFSDGPLALTAEDSAEQDVPIMYQGSDGTILSGGKAIPTSSWEHFKAIQAPGALSERKYTSQKGFNTNGYHSHHRNDHDQRSLMEEVPLDTMKPTSGKAIQPAHRVAKRAAAMQTINIIKVDLKKLNITDYGDLKSGALGDCANDKMEAFYDGKPLILARHPNIGSDGKPTFMNVGKVLKSMSEFEFSDPKLAAVKDAGSMWLHGYWGQDWADNYVRVLKLDGSTSTITTDPKTPPIYGYHTKARFYALNVLEFLDSPGEYYIDRTDGVLYFALPTTAPQDGTVTVSMQPTVLSFDNVSYLTLDKMSVMYSRSTAVTAKSTTKVSLYNSFITAHGGSGLYSTDAMGMLIHNVTASALGCKGMSLEGGDLATLQSGGNSIESSVIHDFGRWKRTYNPGIAFGGVGNSYTRNLVYDGPHSGMLGSCNDCVFSGNTIHDMCYESTDTGAFYTGRSWIHRGNSIFNNTFYNIRTTEKTELGYPSVQAIYLDDQMSGWSIYNNTFINCQKGTFIGGGRHNTVHNNYYESCDVAVHLDDRGLNWQHASCLKNGSFDQQMESVHYDKPPWSTHYPDLLTIFTANGHPCYPVDTSFSDNKYCKCKKFSDVSSEQATKWYASVSGNTEKCR